MRSEDIKKKKESEEVFEEADPALFGEISETKVSGKINKYKVNYERFKSTKWFKPVVIFGSIILFILIVVLSFSGGSIIKGLTSIDTNLPEIIYINEETTFKTEAYGQGDLSKTKYTYNLSNANATLKDLELTGDVVTNTIKVTTLSNIYLTINGELNGKKVKYESGLIPVCNRFTKDLLKSTTISIKQGKTISLGLDLGKNEKCYKNLTYSILNPSIIKLTDDNKISALSTGATELTIKDKQTEVKMTIVVN